MIYKGKKGARRSFDAIQNTYGEDTLRVRLDGNGDATSNSCRA